MTKTSVDFSTGDDLSDLLGSGSTGASPFPTAPEYARIREEVPQFAETCPACRGTGQFRSYSGRIVGQCFKCKGAGKRTFATSPEQRAKAKAGRVERQEEAKKAFSAGHPTEFVWIVTKAASFDFAAKMQEAIRIHGGLTENQLAAVRRCVERDAARDAERAARAAERTAAGANAPRSTTIDCAKIADAFRKASEAGLKRPRMATAGLHFSLAPASGKNPGAIYVKTNSRDDAVYLGRIVGGLYYPTRDAGAAIVEKVITVAADPAAAAKAYGYQEGSCSCCGRLLTDPESIAAGIGPICADRYGF